VPGLEQQLRSSNSGLHLALSPLCDCAMSCVDARNRDTLTPIACEMRTSAPILTILALLPCASCCLQLAGESTADDAGKGGPDAGFDAGSEDGGPPNADAGQCPPLPISCDGGGPAFATGAYACDGGLYPLPGATTGVPYEAQITALCGTSPFKFTIASSGGVLPPGLELQPSGKVDGTPNQVGYFSFTIVMLDSAGSTDQQRYALAVAPF
jgi:Putative Ig domain